MLFDNPVLLQLKKQSEEARKAAGLPPLEDENNSAQGDNSACCSGHKASRKKDGSRECTRRERITTNSQKENIKNYAYGNMKEGFVKATEKTFGFLEVDTRESYFIAPPYMKKLLPGDKILARITEIAGRSQACPVELIEPSLTRFVGKVSLANGRISVIPDRPSFKNYMRAKNHVTGRILKDGDWVVANLTEHAMNSRNGEHTIEINEYITAGNDPEAPWWVVLKETDLPNSAPEDSIDYVFHDADIKRKDYTNIPFVTIDSAKTKDMDDAVYVKKDDSGYLLYVAIADPTGYISENDALNEEAARRSFSIYLPGRDIPMLPRTLSENLCSLWNDEIRHALVGVFRINADGSLGDDITFELADIRSRGKLAYDDVSDYLEGKETDFKPSSEISEVLRLLEGFQNIRCEFRSTHASVFKDRPDYDFILDEKGALMEIKPSFRRIANKIIEEAMIAANACAGTFLAKNCGTAIFNVHPGFDAEKIKEIEALLKDTEAPVKEAEQLLTMDGFSTLKRWLDTEENVYLDARLRKFYSYASMSLTPGPHFGMGLDYYATWTSPIRKYGDMINHRLIKYCILKSAHPVVPDENVLSSMNVAKKQNRMAERGVKDWLYVEYLRQFIDKKTEFQGEIFDISRGGIRVRIYENGASAFIPSSVICDDRLRVDGDSQTGRFYIDKKKVFELGQFIAVRVKEVNADTRSVIAELVNQVG